MSPVLFPKIIIVGIIIVKQRWGGNKSTNLCMLEVLENNAGNPCVYIRRTKNKCSAVASFI